MTRSHKAILSASAAAIAAIGAVDQTFGVAITPGDLVVLQQNTTGNAGVPIQLDEIATSGGTVQTITDSSLYVDGASTHPEGYLSLSNGNTEVSYDGFTVQSAGTENTITTRAAGAVALSTGTPNDPAGTTYSGSSGNYPRSSYSADGTNWYTGDQTGLFYNGTALTGGPSSVHTLANYGGITYSFSGSLISAINPSSPSPGTTTVSLTSIVTVPDSKAQDFTLVSSGNNGSAYDTLYITDQTSNDVIYKYADIGGAWMAEGGVTFTSNTIAGHQLQDITAEEVPGTGVELFFTADSSSHGWLYEMTDSAAYNAPMSSTTGTSALTAIAETPTGDQFEGIIFVPEPAAISLISIAALGLLARRRRPSIT